jgi:general secretion pathway protein A
MYAEYFGLTENPFSITPDPRYLFMSRRHREALAHLLYGIGAGGGFVQLTGEIGMGKTTLCRGLLEQLPDNVDVALILNPRLTALELVASICDEFHISYPRDSTSLKVLIDGLNANLLDAHARGRRTVLVIDEAQNLSTEVLEQVRLLTNLETPREKLLQIILIGQPELKKLLARDDLEQLAQRITARYHLGALAPEESIAYIQHRLSIAGLKHPVFSRAALQRIHRLSGGIPRRINILCDRALLGAYAQDRQTVDVKMVKRAAREVFAEADGGRRGPWRPALVGIGLLAAGIAIGLWWQMRVAEEITTTSSATPAEIAAAPVTPVIEAAPAAAAPGPDIEALLQAHAADLDVGSAFRQLFTRWGHDYDPSAGIAPCDYALRVGLQCLYRRGTWNNLRSLNAPVVVRLVSPGGTHYHAMVENLDMQDVTLALGADREALAFNRVDQYWFGEFVLVWRPPAVRAGALKLGDRGTDVVWVRRQLAALLGGALPTEDSTVFDMPLQERVMAFQRNMSLVEDGIVGEQTLMELTLAAPDPTRPTLNAGRVPPSTIAE